MKRCLVASLALCALSSAAEVSYVDAWRILLTHQQAFDREFLEGNAFLEMNYLLGPMGDQQFNYDVPVHNSRAVEIVHDSLEVKARLDERDASCRQWKRALKRFLRPLSKVETNAYMQWLERVKSTSSTTESCQ